MKRNFGKGWKEFRSSAGFKGLLRFLVFVVIATLFWFILAMNDNVQDNFKVRLHIYNIPDSVTFINDPPNEINVNVRDKGTTLFRQGVMNDPVININFKEYAVRGLFRYTSSDLYSDLRQLFGNSAQVSGVSVDSLHLIYTTNPGKRVPIVINSDVSANNGNVIDGKLTAIPKDVLVYSDLDILDTLTRVYTEKVVKRGLSETTEVDVRLKPMSHVKYKPAKIKVRIPVEALVLKKVPVSIKVENLPPNTSLLLFPSKVDVSYYSPLSKFNDTEIPISVVVDYHDAVAMGNGKRVPVKITSHGSTMVNPTLSLDSVEFTLVR